MIINILVAMETQTSMFRQLNFSSYCFNLKNLYNINAQCYTQISCAQRVINIRFDYHPYSTLSQTCLIRLNH